eukprot:5320359-Pyramimonas_sp.AAC.1
MPFLGQLLGGKDEPSRCHPVPAGPTISWLTLRGVIFLTTPFFEAHVDKVPSCRCSDPVRRVRSQIQWYSCARSPGCGRVGAPVETVKCHQDSSSWACNIRMSGARSEVDPLLLEGLPEHIIRDLVLRDQ